MSPLNTAMFNLSGASSSASVTTPNIITGQGNLQIVGSASVCYYTTNPYTVWITNVTATTAGNGTMNVTFAIEGGQDGYYYDVFAGTILTSPLGNGYWTWQGQGPHCNVYSLTNLPQGTVFLILGTPQDTDSDGLTDAYEKLVSKTDPNNADTDGDGMPDGWEVLLGMNPLTNDNASSSSRANFTYDFADWLNQITGIKSGTVGLDNEGNVTQANQ
jgi:large repetitive protein